jgi:hypothetical protein
MIANEHTKRHRYRDGFTRHPARGAEDGCHLLLGTVTLAQRNRFFGS